ncbi:hypothetical protein AYO44_09210 [Planctomycetaceae bacterium SCGC AG-212-F19]|nr:hypothetical protein AYO44_09210 [Planctomycetaceae bacterium SCGC AG-212-F19]
MELYYFLMPLVIVVMVSGCLIGARAGRKLGGNWSSGVALAMLFAILPPSLLFVLIHVAVYWLRTG